MSLHSIAIVFVASGASASVLWFMAEVNATGCAWEGDTQGVVRSRRVAWWASVAARGLGVSGVAMTVLWAMGVGR